RHMAVNRGKALRRVAYAALVIVLLLVVGAATFRHLENLDWLDAFYFATITLTTIGYGDFVPTQAATKIFVIFYALLGVATVLYLLTGLSRYYVERANSDFERRLTDLGLLVEAEAERPVEIVEAQLMPKPLNRRSRRTKP
ncbi:MAG: potassium channel family protein, partial [Candidatus Micrarchaeota archaeon]|nr:potassium channel family protein [Candidatus Micrarchaeota archaeon]